jgi:hypothetical protein
MCEYRPRDVDWLISAASLPGLSGYVARLLTGERKYCYQVLAAVQKSYGKTRMLTDAARSDIVDALAWWLSHTCEACNGLGRQQIEDTPHLSDTKCPDCQGTGDTPHRSTSYAYAYCLKQLDQALNVCSSLRVA